MSSIHSWFMMLALSLLEAGQRLWRQLTTKLRDERGDVPGWVMITLMTHI